MMARLDELERLAWVPGGPISREADKRYSVNSAAFDKAYTKQCDEEPDGSLLKDCGLDEKDEW